MDSTGQVILHREALATTLGPPGIVDLATGSIAQISAAPLMRFVRE